ncbi:MAG: FliA/WhiG family RNA polymerase sigma factor [Betaproteobacteria bacterium]|nr:FliA/WhiG family RNA polymerase sigma factor [Betaproteobacteria bacterium]
MANRSTDAHQLYAQHENEMEALVMAHLDLVKRISLHLRARLMSFMDLPELIQVGTVGLLEAAKSFDPSKGIPFEHFAHSRVRGAIFDEVRRMSTMPRSAVAIHKQHSAESRQLSTELGREPSQAEVAAALGKDSEDFHEERRKAAQYHTVYLEDVAEQAYAIPDERSRQPDALAEESQFMEVLVRAIEQLPERDQLVMTLYYQDELNLKEIGLVLDVSESRVSQILSANVKKIRKTLGLERPSSD